MPLDLPLLKCLELLKLPLLLAGQRDVEREHLPPRPAPCPPPPLCRHRHRSRDLSRSSAGCGAAYDAAAPGAVVTGYPAHNLTLLLVLPLLLLRLQMLPLLLLLVLLILAVEVVLSGFKLRSSILYFHVLSLSCVDEGGIGQCQLAKLNGGGNEKKLRVCPRSLPPHPGLHFTFLPTASCCVYFNLARNAHGRGKGGGYAPQLPSDQPTMPTHA